mgnify:CR=1 FL=1
MKVTGTGGGYAAVEGDLLDRADLVDGAHRRADDRATGLDRQPRGVDAEGARVVVVVGRAAEDMCSRERMFSTMMIITTSPWITIIPVATTTSTWTALIRSTFSDFHFR